MIFFFKLQISVFKNLFIYVWLIYSVELASGV